MTASGPAWLFCPADRPERYAKAFACADVVVIDLEDAVAPDRKAEARRSLRDADLDDHRVVVRINDARSPEHAKDLELLSHIDVSRVMLAKSESDADLTGLEGFGVIALIESPIGLHRVDDIAASPGVEALMWGADDLVAGLGGTSSRTADGSYRDIARLARVRTLLAAKSHGLLAIDGVFMDIGDLAGLRDESDDGVASGFDAKVAIHPTQVAVIRESFRPTSEQVRWAEELLAAAAGTEGVFTFGGRMVDGPIFAQAHRVLQLAGAFRSGARDRSSSAHGSRT